MGGSHEESSLYSGAGCWAPQGAIIDLILKEVWLFIYLFSICLVAPEVTGTQALAFALPQFRAFPDLGGLMVFAKSA